jgi:hypothetical protein
LFTAVCAYIKPLVMRWNQPCLPSKSSNPQALLSKCFYVFVGIRCSALLWNFTGVSEKHNLHVRLLVVLFNTGSLRNFSDILTSTRHNTQGVVPRSQRWGNLILNMGSYILNVRKLYDRKLIFSVAWKKSKRYETLSTACFKKSFTMIFRMLLCGEYYENVYI